MCIYGWPGLLLLLNAQFRAFTRHGECVTLQFYLDPRDPGLRAKNSSDP